MEKCLLDILDKEHGLVKDINNLSSNIKRISDQRMKLLMSFTHEADYDTDRHYLAHLQDEIDRMNSEKLELQTELTECRRELRYYLRLHILV